MIKAIMWERKPHTRLRLATLMLTLFCTRATRAAPHHAVPETNCANATVLFVLCCTAAATVQWAWYSWGHWGHVCVCVKNIGQAVINGSVHEQSNCSCRTTGISCLQFLYTLECSEGSSDLQSSLLFGFAVNQVSHLYLFKFPVSHGDNYRIYPEVFFSPVADKSVIMR